ncbi:MAG: DUF3501 family protein [Actinomycetota bacterium]|nr:DUF3501 family protein [Actinomycetota bacterium]
MTEDRALTLADIADLRAYERERDAFRAEVIALKRVRRVAVGPIVTLVFENRTTVRFQVQEMARAERMISDEQIQGELDAYNVLIPGPGELSATLFIELTGDEDLRTWLPKLVGIERAVELRIGEPSGEGSYPHIVRSVPEAGHAASLTRAETTPSVHYVQFSLTPEQVVAFADGPVALAVAHPAYGASTELGDATRASLLGDLR